MYDLIIIGSGPAGLSAAVYGKRAGLDLVVLEKNPMSGGQVLNTYEVDNYLGMPGMNGFDMGVKFREHADKLGAEFREASVLSIESGEEGKIVRTAHLLENVPGKITMTAAGPTRSFGPPEPGLLSEEPLPEVNVAHRNYFEHFLKAFNGEEEIIVKPEQVRRVLRLMDAVRESAKTGKSIAFEE